MILKKLKIMFLRLLVECISIKLVFIAIMFDLYKYAQFILHTLANLSFFDFSLILGI